MRRPSRPGGKTGKAKGRTASPDKRRKAARTRRRVAPAATRVKRPVSDAARDLKAAREQQAATAAILKVIASSPSDVQPVFDAIAASANRLIGGFSATVMRFIGDGLHLVASTPTNAAADEALKASFPRPLAEFPPFELVRGGETVQFTDTEAVDVPPVNRQLARLRGYRSMLFTPLMSNATAIGILSVTRVEPGEFASHHVQLLKTFADQAVIAIENARLFNETREALERQTATAEILKVIAGSPSDVQPVFEAIAERSNRLIGGHATAVYRFVGEMVQLEAFTPVSAEADAALKASYPRPIAGELQFELVRGGKVAQIADTDSENVAAITTATARMRGWRSVIFMPLTGDAGVIGAITVTRKEAGAFADHHVRLLHTFADQAVIAIENARLFNETRDALERQTATAEILKVIARSPSDVQPVFDVIVERAVQLCGARMGRVYRYDGNLIHLVGGHGLSVPAREGAQRPFPRPATDDTIVGRVMLSRRPYILADLNEDDTVPPLSRQMIEALGARSQVTMPMLLAGEPIGAITLSWAEPKGYNDHQIALLQTFADQAVIAIENARLFNEVRAKTADLQESLQQQTATADVLKVISRSAFDLETVLDALLSSACRLCEADIGTVRYREGGEFRLAATFGCKPEWIEHFRRYSTKPDRSSVFGRTITEGHIVHIPDLRADPDYKRPEAQKLMGFKAALGVPLAREGEAFGVINLFRFNVSSFEDRQIELVQTFADQAVIAIENTRLFNETREALERQTATADILNVIAGSPSDVQPVFEAIAERSNRLIDGLSTAVYVIVDDALHLKAFTRTSPEADAALQASFPRPLSEAVWGERIRSGELVEIPDAGAEWSEDPALRELMRLRGFRSLLLVPLLRDGSTIGIISVTRAEAGTFAARHVQLLQTFADQAVIAISNVQLFRQVQQRTRELSASLDELRAAQDRLVQTEKLASLGQLTAGIAHEIKNPLNFVNNFSALSAELIDELDEALVPAPFDLKLRADVGELTRTLKSNLEKVVQHGKRADSIVKNMLLHSREGSGEHRSADINALVEESLNLAWHGARAEKSDFSIALQRDLDPSAGMADVYPQEITRALLNFISNGFYAAGKRRAEAGDGFEPVVSATTKNLGAEVEIRIRDNGTGIPKEARDKIFNPFFTTKPSGEGTGLGLSMCHDIIVKQHGGSIDVETEPGLFTEFRIVLPRANRKGSAGR